MDTSNYYLLSKPEQQIEGEAAVDTVFFSSTVLIMKSNYWSMGLCKRDVISPLTCWTTSLWHKHIVTWIVSLTPGTYYVIR